MALRPLQTVLVASARRAEAALERWLDAERDQLALWLPIGLGLGIVGWFALPDAAGWTALILTSGGVAAMAALLPGYGRAGRALGIFAFTAMIGCALIWWRAERVSAPVLARPVVASFTARVEAVDSLAASERVRLRLAPDAASGLPARVRVNVDDRNMVAGIEPGTVIGLRARLVPPPAAALPGAYDFARVAWFQGLGATGRALGPLQIVAPSGHGGFALWMSGLRARLSAHIRASAPGAPGGIASALATGDMGGIPEADSEAMRRSGLAHLLSVSGLHVTAAVGAVMLLVLRLLALSPTLALRAPLLLIAAGAGALAAIGYTLLTGAEVPTVRSCVAALLVLGGIALGRDALTLRLVAAGAVIVLLVWPESLAGASFQLSFAAVASIVALHEHPKLRAFLARRDEGRGRRLLRALTGLLFTGLVVELALAPIALFHFNRAGLYGAIANIVAIPLTTFVVMPLEALALLLDLVGLGAPLWWLTVESLKALLWIAHHVAATPGAVAALPTMPSAAFALMVSGGLWLTLWRTKLRRLGLVPLALGAAWALATPTPDLLVTSDGRHLALVGEDGRIALLRPRAGDYVRGQLSESAGTQEEALDLGSVAGAACSPDLCAAELVRGGRRWRLLATRSPYFVDIAEMNAACAAADIVVSERRLPRSCRPRWLKADRELLARTGGLAIRLAGPTVDTVAGRAGRHPWVLTGR
jgi:competence protein ComEC